MTTDDTQVLTFTLGEEDYCVDIGYVAEIVDGDEMTSLPNTEAHVEGIMDLRDNTTMIVNPSKILETEDIRTEDLVTDGGETNNRVIVLDSERLDSDTTTGWIVSDVDEVTDVSETTMETDSVQNADLLRGLLKDDDGFTIWLDPHELTA